MAYKLSRSELVSMLQEQMDFIRNSAASFDTGSQHEALRLAVTLRVLLHDTGSSKSLLKQLGEKDKLRFLDTCTPIHQGSFGSSMGLVRMTLTAGERSGAEYKAPLGDFSSVRVNDPKPFDPWWSDPVTKDAGGRTFSRRDYVLALANKEGGAHIDQKLNAQWAALTRHNSLGWSVVVDANVPEPMGTPALASVRQIAYEVDDTVTSQLGHLL